MAPYLIDHYGDIASVVGLLVTFFGFVATIKRVREAERAAVQARQAASETLMKVGSQLLANEVGTALQLVREIDAACRDRNWTSAIHRCDEARARLAPLQDDPSLMAEERDSIRNAADEFRVIIGVIVKVQDDAESKKPFPPKVGKSLHDMIVFLGRVKGRLQSKALEV